jgi:hypothetical protein
MLMLKAPFELIFHRNDNCHALVFLHSSPNYYLATVIDFDLITLIDFVLGSFVYKGSVVWLRIHSDTYKSCLFNWLDAKYSKHHIRLNINMITRKLRNFHINRPGCKIHSLEADGISNAHVFFLSKPPYIVKSLHIRMYLCRYFIWKKCCVSMKENRY